MIAKDVKLSSHLIKTQQIRCRPVCIHYQFLHAPTLALNIRQPLMPPTV